MVRLRMQARRKRRGMREASTILEKDRQSLENRRVFGEIAEECVRHN
jgi:hypothetical protein